MNSDSWSDSWLHRLTHTPEAELLGLPNLPNLPNSPNPPHSRTQYVLRSQTWHSISWTHDLVLVEPSTLRYERAALLYVTGGATNPFDEETLQLLANEISLPVVGLFHIPAQPLFDGLEEDDLIAETFVRFLDTGDDSWPLLAPMVRSVFAAMDVLADRFDRWIITGGSKRGWTSWLAGVTGDPRIAGIAPMVFDQLNAGAQLQAQWTQWGRLSPMIEPYVTRGMPEALATERGRELAALVDPYSWLDSLRAPVYMVHGANDPYWTVDALERYWDAISTSKAVQIHPNRGHDVADGRLAAAGLQAFAAHCFGDGSWPQLSWIRNGLDVEVQSSVAPVSARVWSAKGPDAPFSEREWTAQDLDGLRFRLEQGSEDEPTAAFLELEFAEGLRLTTQAFRSP